MIFIEQIVVDKSTLYTIEVDGPSTSNSIFVENVSIDFRISTDAISSLAIVCIDLDSSTVVMMTDVVSNDRPVAAIRYIDAVLINRVEAFVVFKQDIICKPSKDASFKIIVAKCIAHDTVIRKNQSDAIPGLVDDSDTIDLDVISIFDIDTIGGHRIRRIDYHITSEGDEYNWVDCSSRGPVIESNVVAVRNPDGITCIDLIGCILECPPGQRPRVA